MQNFDSLRVEVEGGFVEDQKRHLLEEGHSEPKALEHSTGELSDPPSGVVGEGEEVENLVDSLRGDLSQAGEEVHDLTRGEHIRHGDALGNE